MTELNILSPDGGKLVGTVATLKVRIPIEMRPAEKHTEKSPDWSIYSNGVKIGVAFTKRTKDRNEEFYTMTLDDPSWPQPLYLTAFPRNDGGQVPMWEITYQRPRQKEAA